MALVHSSSDPDAQKNVEAVNTKLSSALAKVNKRNLEKEIESLTSTKRKKGSSAAVYKLREKVLGPKETMLDAVVIDDPESGFPIHDPNQIKAASLKY